LLYKVKKKIGKDFVDGMVLTYWKEKTGVFALRPKARNFESVNNELTALDDTI
jgi:hypothetical protein